MAERVLQLRGHLGGFVGVRAPAENDRELIPAHTCDCVHLPQAAAQPLGHRAQEGITRAVSVSIVYELEPVEIEEHDRQRPPLAMCLCKALCQTVAEQEPV